VVLLATLGSVGIPLEGLAFIAGVDRILDMARTALNVVGNALAVLVIAKWEHKFDRKKRWRMNARCWVVLIRRLTSNVKAGWRLRLTRPTQAVGPVSAAPPGNGLLPLNASNSSHPVSNPSVQLRFNQYSAFCLLGVIKPFSPCLNNIPAQYSA
jgi:hypothetical protein